MKACVAAALAMGLVIGCGDPGTGPATPGVWLSPRVIADTIKAWGELSWSADGKWLVGEWSLARVFMFVNVDDREPLFSNGLSAAEDLLPAWRPR